MAALRCKTLQLSKSAELIIFRCFASTTQGSISKKPESSSKKGDELSPKDATKVSAKKSAGSKGIQPDDYKVQEYFNHNIYSFYDIERKMVPARLPQPSPKAPEAKK